MILTRFKPVLGLIFGLFGLFSKGNALYADFRSRSTRLQPRTAPASMAALAKILRILALRLGIWSKRLIDKGVRLVSSCELKASLTIILSIWRPSGVWYVGRPHDDFVGWFANIEPGYKPTDEEGETSTCVGRHTSSAKNLQVVGLYSLPVENWQK